MDEKDEKIISLLKENAKLSTHEISKAIFTPITTVHNRIKKLEKAGVIKGYTLKLNYEKLGKTLAAYTLVSIDYKKLKETKTSPEQLIRKLKMYDEVEEVSLVTGSFDIVLKIRAKNMKEMDKFLTGTLREPEGMGPSQTLMILHES